MANYPPRSSERETNSGGLERDPFDLRVRLLQLYLMFAGALLLGLFFFMVYVRRRVGEVDAAGDLLETFDQTFLAGFVAFLGFLFVIGVVYWLLLSWQFRTPLERLEAFSSRVLWRGGLRKDEEAALHQLVKRQDPIGSVARSLLLMAQDTERRFVQLSMLLETNRIVASSLDIGRVMDNILGQLQRLFAVDRAAVLTLDERAGVFRTRASRGMSAEYVDTLRIAPSDPDSPGMRALRQKQPIQVADTETDLSYEHKRQITRRFGHRSVLAIPLQTRHSPPTVLILQKTQPYRYSYSELELAVSFGNQASIALENAALFGLSDEKLQEQTRRLEAIVESLKDGLILAGLDGRVLFCNQRALELVDLPRSQVLNVSTHSLVSALTAHTPESEKILDQLQASVRGTPNRPIEFSRPYLDKQQDLRLQLFDVTDARGERIGHGQLWQDITPDRELDRMKSTLLSTVSHELRTPLATIKGYATTLLARDVAWDSEAQREFLETISGEADRLAELIKNLLDMSRIEANLLEVNRQPFPLNDVIQQVISRLPAEERARIEIDLPDDLPLVPIDLPRIETVVRNLLTNALKYADPTGRIGVVTRPAGSGLVCTIRDQGLGVPAAYQDQIFDPFFRVDDGLTREVGGVGLGLAISKGFVEAHGGRIWINSDDDETAFSFSLPLPERMPEAASGDQQAGSRRAHSPAAGA